MGQIPQSLTWVIALGAALVLAPIARPTLAQEGTPTDNPGAAEASQVPRWLEEVRAQRRALQAQRRAQHEARRRAIDPVGAAQQQAREAEFLRRRQERRAGMEQDRRLFLNQGLGSDGGGLLAWPEQSLAPPIVDPGDSGRATVPVPPDQVPPDHVPPDYGPPDYVPPDWDNGWYFRGW